MGARGRPTPQPAAAEGPRFRDRLPEDYRRPDINPYVALHRTYGDVVLTVELPTESLDAGEVESALSALVRHAIEHRGTLRKAAS